jgi:hypothetical protein
VQSVKSSLDPSHLVDPNSDVDKIIHNEEEDNEMSDLENVMVLRKGRKIRHRKKSIKKKKNNNSPPKLRYIPNKRWVCILSSPSTFQNDWSYMELPGSG